MSEVSVASSAGGSIARVRITHIPYLKNMARRPGPLGGQIERWIGRSAEVTPPGRGVAGAK